MAEYWERRKGFPYYRHAVRLAKTHAPSATSVLDVGGRDCEYVLWYDWIPCKVIVDLQSFPVPGVKTIQEDFLKFSWEARFDLVLCLQVLEHLEDPSAFAHRLLSAGKTVIVSVPDRWPHGQCENHPHDPIDEEKLDGWMGATPIARENVDARIISVYKGYESK